MHEPMTWLAQRRGLVSASSNRARRACSPENVTLDVVRRCSARGGSTCGVQLATNSDDTRSSDRDDSLPSDRLPGRTKLRAIRWSIRSRLAEHPRPYLPIARAKVPDAVLCDDTELLIEGFTRSAVTFATIAFQLAQRRPVRAAHTLHSVGHVRMAVRRAVPSLVTDPRARGDGALRGRA